MEIALIIEFELEPGAGAAFERLMSVHARATLESEPGCRRFDILHPLRDDETTDDNRRLLFELYDDAAALQTHNDTARLAELRQAYAPLIRNVRVVRCLVIKDPATAAAS